MSKYLIASIIIVTFILGIGIGFMITPEYEKSKNHSMAQDINSDEKFVSEMIKHHTDALQMANKIKTITKREELKNLSDEIVKAQSEEIRQLKEWEKEWFNNK